MAGAGGGEDTMRRDSNTAARSHDVCGRQAAGEVKRTKDTTSVVLRVISVLQDMASVLVLHNGEI